MRKKFAHENQLSLIFDGVVDAVLDPVPEAPPNALAPVAIAAKVASRRIEPEVFFQIGSQLDAVSGEAAKIRYNLAALELLDGSSGNFASLDSAQRDILVRYTGWGGAANVFDPDTKYKAQQDRLKELLSETRYRSARESVLTAYYTPSAVIRAMWKVVGEMGFQGGNVLDPSAGIGHFTGCMPGEMRSASTITMVEPDNVSASIAKALYASRTARIHCCGIEDAPLRANSFDLVISNIPFGNYKLNDKRFNAMKLVIHDYFFAKALDLVRPGGIVAFLTTTGTLDKDSTRLRSYLAQKADLVTALRLPNSTFEALGGTSVGTDILVLRKKPAVEDGRKGLDFTAKHQAPNLREGYVAYCVNEVFAANPHLHLGKAVVSKSHRYGEKVVWETKLPAEVALPEALDRAIESMAEWGHLQGWYAPAEDAIRDPLSEQTPQSVRSGYFFDLEGRVAYIDPYGNAESQSHLPAATYDRLARMIALRDIALELIEREVSGQDGASLRRALNDSYDGFVKRHGALMLPKNRKLISLDGHAPLLWSMERYCEHAEAWLKADIFTMSTVSRATLAETAESIGDAIALSYNRFGRIDLPFMASALRRDEDEVTAQLLDVELAYEDPADGRIVDATEYLSGDVRAKLICARSGAMELPRFDANVKALEAVMPTDVPLEMIAIRLGAPWLHPEEIEAFAQSTFEVDDKVCEVSHSPLLSAWTVKAGSQFLRDGRATGDWGTGRRNFFDLLQAALNQQQPKVTDKVEVDGKFRDVVNIAETTAARDKAEKIHQAFEVWIKQDGPRGKALEERYNKLFNSTVNRKYDGSHLMIPGLNPQINLRDAQKDSIWRGVVSGNVLYALAVGGGKTLIQICLAQELKRLGLAQKPTLVVPNHMLEAFAGEYLRAFPRAKVLAATKEDLVGDKRKTLLMRIASGNWDAIIVTHASFGKIGLSKEATDTFIEATKCELDDALSECKGSAEDRDSVRDIERTKKSIEAKLEALTERGERDDGCLTFDKLGIDQLIVDEADLFKNLWFFTRKTRIAGINTTASIRAFDMFLKSREVFRRRGGDTTRGLAFATATPIANTVAELFIMQLYLQENALAQRGISRFDAWAANFGREVTSIEVAPDGSGYRMHTRFCKFDNVPELMTVFREVAEIRTKAVLNLPVPSLAGGSHTVVSVPASDVLKDYVAGLVKRAEAIRNRLVEPAEDNMLCVTSDGRKAALDMRCIDSALPDYKGGKVNACLENVFRHWEEGEGQRLTQLVFCDLSTPANTLFSVYRDMREKLIARGVTAAEIAFAQDYGTDLQKAELHRKVRVGKIRVLFGSTELMGFGTNVQDRLIAEHHLDAPWRPRDVEQRDGRIERQGNLNDEIWIYRYVTEGSFDAYMWQTLETKARFIAQVMEGKGDVRSIEDVTSQALSYAEIKAIASGNPLVIEKAGVDAEVAKLSQIRAAFHEQQWQLRQRLHWASDSLASVEQSIAALKSDLSAAEGLGESLVVDGRSYPSGEQLGKLLMEKMAVARIAAGGRDIGDKRVIELASWAGFTLTMEFFGRDGVRKTLCGPSGLKVEPDMPMGKDAIARWLPGLKQVYVDVLEQRRLKRDSLVSEVASLQQQVGRTFEYEERLRAAVVRQEEIDASLGLMQSDSAGVALEEVGEAA